MQLQLALLLSQLPMFLFSRVCRTFVFVGRFFLASSLFVCLFVYWFICWFVWGESRYDLEQMWAVCHELLGVLTILGIAITIKIMPTVTVRVTVTVTVTVMVMVIVMIITKN